MTEKELHVYLVEIWDAGTDVRVSDVFLAMSIMDAMQHAIVLYKNSYGISLDLDAISRVELLSGDHGVFATFRAREWLKDQYFDRP